MGNRAAFGFRDYEGRILWLYAHEGGYDMFKKLADAIAHAEPRWDGEECTYGTRMMISHMIGEKWDSEYGFGIGFDLPDTAHSVPVVDFGTNEVWLYPYPGYNPNASGNKNWALSDLPKYRIGFELFCKKYGSWTVSNRFAHAQPKSLKTETEEPRYTKAEWLELLRTL
jgi:hypothetical protein